MKRLNFKLVVSLLAGTLVLGVLVVLVHGYQVERNADSLKQRADKAIEEGNTKHAIDLLTQYLRHRREDKEAYEQLSKLVSDVLLNADRSTKVEDLRKALGILESALLEHPDLKDARMCMARLRMGSQQGLPDALRHVEYLQNDLQVEDPELDLMFAQIKARTDKVDEAVERLLLVIGYDKEKKKFDSDKATAGDRPEAYRLLAELLRKQEKTQAADNVMNRLISVNPESSAAHLHRGQYRQMRGMLKEARADLDKAIKLDPDNLDATLALSDALVAEKDYETAEKLLTAALEKHSKNERIYATLAALSLTAREGDPAERMQQAEKYIAAGLEAVPDGPALHFLRANLQLQNKDLDGARDSIKKMRSLNIRPDVIDLVEARILVFNSKWREASRLLERTAPNLAASLRSEGAQAYVLLGGCYEALGMPDKSLEPYNRAASLMPSNVQAKLGRARILQAIGKGKEGLDIVKQESENSDNNQLALVGQQARLQGAVGEQMAVPADRRNWSEVDKILEQILESPAVNEVSAKLLQAKVTLIKGDLPQGRKMLDQIKARWPAEVGLWTTYLELVQQEDKYDEIPVVLAEMEKAVGDVPAVRINRISWLSQQTDEQSAADLKKQEENLDKFKGPQQITILQSLAEGYARRGDYDNLRRCYLKVAETAESLQVWQILFDHAQYYDKEADMDQAIKQIERIDGAESDIKKYAEAARIVWRIAKEREDKKSLPVAQRLIESVKRTRPDWSELHRLEGGVAELKGDQEAAMVSYRRALDLGRAHTGVARRLVVLLYGKGRIKEAADVMAYVGPIGPGDPLWKMHIELLQRTGRIDAATRRVDVAMAGDPSAEDLIYYGGFYVRTDRKDEAETAFRRAVEKQPELADAWLILIEWLVKAEKMDEAAAALREARGAIPAEKSAVTMALAYEMLGDLDAAEENYKLAIEQSPEELLIQRQLCSFYGRHNQPDKGLPYIEVLVKRDLKPSEPGYASVAWARRTKAKIIADQGEFQHLQQAARLIDQNAIDGKLPAEDLLMLASLFGARPEAALRANAVHLLEELEQTRRLTSEENLALAQLYEQADKWRKCKDRMTDLLATVGNNPQVLVTYTRLLLKHGDSGDAEVLLRQLEQAKGDERTIKELRAWLLVTRGQGPEAVAELRSNLPSPLTDQHLPMVESMAGILEELGQNEAAENLLREFAAEHPRGLLILAAHLGRHGNLDEAFDLMERAREAHALGRVIQAGLDSLRRNPALADAHYFGFIEKWLETGLAEEPDSSTYQLQTADLRDQQGQYDAVVALYRAFLGRDDADAWQRALIKNNLAFVLAMRAAKSGDADEALQLVNEAIEVLGQTSDLLDTRAIVYYAQGKWTEAIADSDAAVRDTEAASKYFHMALIQDKAGNAAPAKAALKKAVELKLEPGQLPRVEHKAYQDLLSRVRLN